MSPVQVKDGDFGRQTRQIRSYVGLLANMTVNVANHYASTVLARAYAGVPARPPPSLSHMGSSARAGRGLAHIAWDTRDAAGERGTGNGHT